MLNNYGNKSFILKREVIKINTDEKIVNELEHSTKQMTSYDNSFQGLKSDLSPLFHQVGNF